QANPARIEEFRTVKPGRLVRGHFGAEAAVAEVRPVTHFAVSNANKVGKTVAGHVGKEDRFSAIGENQLRPFLLVQGLGHALSPTEAFGSQGRVPAKSVVFADQQVREAVAGEINESQVG